MGKEPKSTKAPRPQDTTSLETQDVYTQAFREENPTPYQPTPGTAKSKESLPRSSKIIGALATVASAVGAAVAISGMVAGLPVLGAMAGFVVAGTVGGTAASYLIPDKPGMADDWAHMGKTMAASVVAGAAAAPVAAVVAPAIATVAAAGLIGGGIGLGVGEIISGK